MFEDKNFPSNTEAAPDWIGTEIVELKTTPEKTIEGLQISNPELNRNNVTMKLDGNEKKKEILN